MKKEIFRETIRMAWPAILESFFIALAGLVDSYMVSSLARKLIAAVVSPPSLNLMGIRCIYSGRACPSPH